MMIHVSERFFFLKKSLSQQAQATDERESCDMTIMFFSFSSFSIREGVP